MSKSWIAALGEVERRAEPAVMITVITEKGSTPRNTGAKMLVTALAQYDTIGGGHLEYKAIAQAREMMTQRAWQVQQEDYSLGASLGQCCGGSTRLLFEPLHCRQPSIVVFGAGHVAQALIPILRQLPCRIRWVDQRAEQFNGVDFSDVEQVISETPVDEVARQGVASYYLVMTHDHQLDQRLAQAILARDDAAYFGLIGSRTKRVKFEHRLRARGISERQLQQMICPVGVSEVIGKLPIEIAISIAAQIVAHYNADRAANGVTEQAQTVAS